MDYNTNPDTGHVYLTSELGNIVSTEVIDEYTVKINLSTVDAALPSVFTNICGLMLAPSTLGAEDMAIHPVGTGAFKLEEYVEGDHIFLTAYENYWDKGADGQALPYLNRVEIYIMGDDSVRTINLQTGDIDMVDYHLSGNSIMKAMDMSNVITVMTNNRSTYFLSFNLNDECMGKALVRQAVSYAVNREELIEVCLEGFGVVDASTRRRTSGSTAAIRRTPMIPRRPRRCWRRLASRTASPSSCPTSPVSRTPPCASSCRSSSRPAASP